jgi:hypothetical protein
VRSGSRFWFTSIYCSQLEALCYWLLCSTIKAHFGSCSTLNNFLASQEHKTQTWGFGHNTLWHCHKCCDYFISIPMKSSYTYPFFVSCLLYNTWGYYAMLKHGHMKRADPSRSHMHVVNWMDMLALYASQVNFILQGNHDAYAYLWFFPQSTLMHILSELVHLTWIVMIQFAVSKSLHTLTNLIMAKVYISSFIW